MQLFDGESDRGGGKGKKEELLLGFESRTISQEGKKWFTGGWQL
jgi:hypothetical protein